LRKLYVFTQRIFPAYGMAGISGWEFDAVNSVLASLKESRSMTMEKKRIIVADDEEDILQFIKYFLESAGYDVNLCKNGTGIPHLQKEEYPDLFLLDLAMSGTDGRDICKGLKANKETSSIPVIIISANPDVMPISRECGAEAYLAKPFDIRHLLAEVEKQLTWVSQKNKTGH
jgi:DNA-binding response OmpR family regulator